MYCSKCGTQNPDDAGFCSKCGNNFISIDKTAIESKGIKVKLGKMGVPGFRSGKTWKMVLATFTYLWIGLVFLAGFSEKSDQQIEPVPNQTYSQTQTTPSEKSTEIILKTYYMNNIMSGVYNQYSNLNMSLLRYEFINKGKKPVKLKFITEIQDYTQQSTDIITIEPFSAKTIKQSPLLKPSIEIKEIQNANLHYQVIDIADNKIVDEKTIPIKLYAKDTMIWSVNSDGQLIDTSYLIGAWVTPHITEIDKIIRIAAEYHPEHTMEGYQCTYCQTDQDWADYTRPQVKAIYNTLKNRYKITYINAPISFSSNIESSQRVKLPKDAINLASANCIDGTVLFASALETVGINPKIIVIPSHAFLCWDVNENGKMVDCLETTMVSTSSYEEANNRGLDEYKEERANFEDGTSKIISIKELRNLGLKPMS